MIRGYTEKITGNPLSDAYLQGEQQVLDLYHYKSHDQADLEMRAKEVESFYEPWRRKALVDALRKYADHVTGLSPQTEALLEKLSHQRALVVVTGQQAGLFTGPLYTIYKAVTAVAYASYYEKMLDQPVVPVFWVAAEDHDFQEVAEAWFIKESGELFRSHLREHPVMRTPIGLHHISPVELTRLLNELSVQLPEGMHREEVLQQLSDSYMNADNMVDGFICLLAKWMTEFPILFLNPLDADLRHLMKDAFQKVLSQPQVFQQAAISGAQAVTMRGFAPQVEVVERHTLIYVIEHGKRSALDYDSQNEVFTLRDTKRVLSKEELQKRLETSPQDFSAGVLYRPVTQDYVLPVLAYVGGAAEIAYHGMMKGIFEASGRKIPPLLLRQRAFLLPGQVNRALDRFSLKVDEVLSGDFVFEHLLQNETHDLDTWVENLKASLEADLLRYRSVFLEVDQQLEKALAKTEFTIFRGIDRLSVRARRALLRKHGEVATSAQLIEGWILPRGKDQERILSPLSPVVKYGVEWVRNLWFDTPPPWHEVKCIVLK